MVDGEYVVNPTLDQMPKTQVIWTWWLQALPDAVLMVESEARELSEEVMLGAVMKGHEDFQPVIEAIIRLAERAAREPREHVGRRGQVCNCLPLPRNWLKNLPRLI